MIQHSESSVVAGRPSAHSISIILYALETLKRSSGQQKKWKLKTIWEVFFFNWTKKWSVYSKANDNYGYLPQPKNGLDTIKKFFELTNLFFLFVNIFVVETRLREAGDSSDQMCHLVGIFFPPPCLWLASIIANNISFIN